MTYNELFLLKGMNKAKLLAGKGVLKREITGAHVVEMVESQNWVKRGELVFVSGVAFHDIEEDFMQFIKAVSEMHVAGVVVEVGPYIQEISEKTIHLADQYDVPLLSLPYEVRVSELISQIYFDLYTKEENNRSVEKFMQELLYDNQEKALLRKDIFWSEQNKKKIALWVGIDEAIQQAVQEDEESTDILLTAVRMSFRRQEKLLYYVEDEGIAIIFEIESERNLHEAIEKKRREIEENLGYIYKEESLSMGVGTIFSNIMQLKDSVGNAKKAYKILRSCKRKGAIRYYDEIGIYQLFFAIEDGMIMENLYYEILGNLLRYDKQNNAELVKTLEVYLEEKENITTTAQRLFVHRNTVKYRMKCIAIILEKDLKDVNVLFNLRLAFKIKKYKGAQMSESSFMNRSCE